MRKNLQQPIFLMKTKSRQLGETKSLTINILSDRNLNFKMIHFILFGAVAGLIDVQFSKVCMMVIKEKVVKIVDTQVSIDK